MRTLASATGWATSASETCIVTAPRPATALRAGMEPALKPDTRVAPAANIMVIAVWVVDSAHTGRQARLERAGREFAC